MYKKVKEIEHMNYLNIIVLCYKYRKTLGSMYRRNRTFKKILDREIETSHTAVKGDAICRFILKPNKQEFL
ncbi:MAG: hypothetical protein ACM3VV_02030 [Deltaproteobacteria bacterium]